MALKAALPSAGILKVPQLAFLAKPNKLIRPSLAAYAVKNEINTDDTPGVSSLLDRDFKIVELDEDAFAEEVIEVAEEAETAEDVSSEGETAAAGPRISSAAANASKDGPKRSKYAIAAGLDMFSQGNYSSAVEMFQLALELPGSGVMRMAGSPKEYACPSEGEEHAALYNMACAYCKMQQPSAALTCIEALLESGFDDYQTIRSDPDLAPMRGSELDKLLSKYDGPLAKLFGKKKEEPKPKGWIQW